MFWMKNSAMFKSSAAVWDSMQNQSDLLWLWEIFSLTRILTDLLMLCEVCVLSADLLSVLLHLSKNMICHCCCWKQFINTSESVVLSWAKMNSAVRTVQLSVTDNWLENVWERLSQTVWKTSAYLCDLIE